MTNTATAEPSSAESGRAEQAPAAGKVMARAGEENFPVASRFLPREMRSHLLALYGFARLVDDVGDESEGDRLALLEQVESELENVWLRRPVRNPLIRRLASTIRACSLPIDPFRRLVEANRLDQMVHRYGTFEELMRYCALSANPVGELVLRVWGLATPQRVALSDSVCTGLQLVEHWQDVAEDYRAGRIYLPRRDRERFGVAEDDLGARTVTPGLRDLLAFEVSRTHRLLDDGAPLIATLRGRPALAVAAFVAGGRAALRAIEHAEYDVLGKRPRPTRWRASLTMAQTTLLWVRP